jgi:phosphoribosylformylglycinamidine synthase
MIFYTFAINAVLAAAAAILVTPTYLAKFDMGAALGTKAFFAAIGELNREDLILAYHDRSDGGLLATLCEMAFAGHTGLDLEILSGYNVDSTLFNEELGAVIQIRTADLDSVSQTLRQHGFKACTTRIGTLNREHRFRIKRGGKILLDEDLFALRAVWSDVTHRMAALRDLADVIERAMFAQQPIDRVAQHIG